jgi:uncharacterized protein YdaU (DUF1376 family)
MSLAYFPLYPSDFDADTGHLSLAEDGAYNRLLRLSWRCPEARMPSDLEWIFRKVRAVTDEDKAVIQSVLTEFFVKRKGKIFSPRLQKEWAKAHVQHLRKVEAGKKGGRAKALKTNETEASSALAGEKLGSSNQNQNQNHKERDTVDTDVSTAADAPEVDLAKAMFDQGVKLLAAAGTPQTKARSLLGKWRRDHGSEAVIVALGRAQREGAIDPVGFVEGALRFRSPAGARASPTIGERRTLQSGMVQEWAGASEGWQEVRC